MVINKGIYSGGRLLVEWMAGRGLTHFFNVPGESFLPVLDALQDFPEITVVTNRHESGASFAAEGFAKVAGRPAVCMATRGPGASNLSIGVQTAYYDATPMLALVGLVPTAMVGSRAFQEFDVAGLFGSISKRTLLVTQVESLGAVLDEAYELATTGRPGPVIVGLPSDMLGAESQPLRQTMGPPAAMPLTWDASAVGDLLMSAERPAFLAATGCVRGAEAHALGELAGRMGLPVYAAWRRFSAVDNGHPNFAGSLSIGGPGDIRGSLAQCDLVLNFGFGLEQITAEAASLNRAGLRIVQFAAAHDAEGARHAALADVTQVPIAPSVALAGLGRWLDASPAAEATLRDRHGAQTAGVRGRALTGREGPAAAGAPLVEIVMREVNRVLPVNAVVASDAGNFGQWVARHLDFDRQRAFIGPINGAMGYAIPAAIGAQFAEPARPAWAIAGDGGAAMTMMEVATAVGRDLDLLVLVIDNGVYGTIRHHQQLHYPGRLGGTLLGGIDFATVARGMGCAGFTIESPADVHPVLTEVAGLRGCRVVHARVGEHPLSIT